MAAGEERRLTPARIFGAVALGLVLAALPFVHYVGESAHSARHSDHEPRHGGQLGMIGDHHVEVRRADDSVEVFVTDAFRRPVRAAGGWVAFDGNGPTALDWKRDRLKGRDVATARVVETGVLLEDGTELRVTFDFAYSDR